MNCVAHMRDALTTDSTEDALQKILEEGRACS